MTFDDIKYKFDGHAYVWVKPTFGTWEDAINERGGNNSDWRPAKLVGTCIDVEDRGTQLDGRRLVFFGQAYGFRLDKFECGGVITMEETPSLAPSF